MKEISIRELHRDTGAWVRGARKYGAILVRDRNVVTSGIARGEISAAFHRKLCEHSVERVVFKALQGQFQHDLAEGLWTLVEPTEVLLRETQTLYGSLDECVFLRSLDAMHLVTASAERFKKLYTSDRHLLDSCRALGMEGINPMQ